MGNELTAQLPPQEQQQSYWLPLFAIIIGAFVAILNNSLLNIAIPQLMNVFGSTQDRIQWVLTGYMLASGIIIPISGYAGDRLGYKKFFLLSLAVFTGGAFLCAIAWSDMTLIIARVIQGLGGGVIMPISMALIYKIVPRNQIGMALGLWGISAMVAPAIGPTLSGYLIEWFNWRFLFIINIPIALFALFMVSILLKETEIDKTKTFDFMGFFLIATSCATMLYALSNGNKVGWMSFEIVFLLYIAISALILLIWVEKGKENPIIELSLFKNFPFTLSLAISSFLTVGLMGGMFLIPIYFQNIQHISAVDTGILLMPQAIAMALMMPIAGKLFDKFGAIPVGVVGLILSAVPSYELYRLTADTSHSWINFVLIVRGLGLGLCMMPINTAGMNAVLPKQVGNASSLSNLIRQVAGSISIAILTMIMQKRAALHGSYMVESITLDNPAIFQVSGSSPISLSTLGSLIQLESTTRGIADTFWIAALPLFLCIPLVFFFKKPKQTE
ncbi:DHA2 family efflux MFS transporter permease subunit [Schinkia azotoformans]|uniref:DHA2 family efflux MFS transporter permease subunit n=1 Tax=Schinkia azotoformans TaxID=1454 RepID=UPI002E24673F|nr:DHA2 family efflux MFS transporter permease subunit [Schinkia azotoformans]